jgi:hypothetical protein
MSWERFPLRAPPDATIPAAPDDSNPGLRRRAGEQRGTVPLRTGAHALSGCATATHEISRATNVGRVAPASLCEERS